MVHYPSADLTERNGTLSKAGEYMRAGDDDPDVKVIALTGAGRGFRARIDIRGTDLGQFEPNRARLRRSGAC